MSIREMLNKSPMAGWGVAAAAFAVAIGVFFWTRGSSGPEPTDKVTVVFSDTGEQVEMYRGRLERELTMTSGPIDPSKGIVNPKTGVASGFIVDKADWERLCEQINAGKKAAAMHAKPPAK